MRLSSRLLALGAMLLVGPCGRAQTVETRGRAVAVAGPKIAADVLKKAIDAYVPVMYLHKDEKYLPTSAEKYLDVTEPFSYVDRDSGKTYVGLRLKGQPNPEDRLKRGAPTQAKTYVNVKVGEKTTDIQYWFLYAYNGPGTAYIKGLDWDLRFKAIGDYELGEMGVHEGDWEHLTVRIDNRTGQALSPEGLFLSEHGSGNWGDPAKTMVDYKGASRVRIYASRNGHALYFESGRSYNVTVKAGPVEFRLLNDTEKVGIPIDYKGKWQLIGVQNDEPLKQALGFEEPAWVSAYPGRWGRIMEKPHPYADVAVVGRITEKLLKAAGAYDELTFEAGPYPPWSKGIFTTEAE